MPGEIYNFRTLVFYGKKNENIKIKYCIKANYHGKNICIRFLMFLIAQNCNLR